MSELVAITSGVHTVSSEMRWPALEYFIIKVSDRAPHSANMRNGEPPAAGGVPPTRVGGRYGKFTNLFKSLLDRGRCWNVSGKPHGKVSLC